MTDGDEVSGGEAAEIYIRALEKSLAVARRAGGSQALWIEGLIQSGIDTALLSPDRLNPQGEPSNMVDALYYIGDQLKNLHAVLDEALPELTNAAQIKRRYVTIVPDDEY